MSIRCALLPCGPTYSARCIGVWRFADYLPRARRCLVAVPRRVSVANRHLARARAGAHYACSLCSGALHVMGLNRHRTVLACNAPWWFIRRDSCRRCPPARNYDWHTVAAGTDSHPPQLNNRRQPRTSDATERRVPQRTRTLPVPVQAPLGMNESPGRPTEGSLTTHFHAHHMALQL